MPVVQCPIAGCTFITEDIGEALAIVLLQIHAGAAHTQTARPRAPRLERPRIDSGGEPVAWANFVRRWELFRSG